MLLIFIGFYKSCKSTWNNYCKEKIDKNRPEKGKSIKIIVIDKKILIDRYNRTYEITTDGESWSRGGNDVGAVILDTR